MKISNFFVVAIVLAVNLILIFPNGVFAQGKIIGKEIAKEASKATVRKSIKNVSSEISQKALKEASEKMAKNGAKTSTEKAAKKVAKKEFWRSAAEAETKESLEKASVEFGEEFLKDEAQKIVKKETYRFGTTEMKAAARDNVEENMRKAALDRVEKKGGKEVAEEGTSESAEKIVKNSNLTANEKYQRGKELDEMYSDPKQKQEMYDNLSEEDRKILDDYQKTKYSNRGYKNIPRSNGKWSGEPGNSKWYPDRDKVPMGKGTEGYNNPQGKTWGEILDECGIDGIPYKNGEPDFSVIAKMKTELNLDTDISDKARRNLLSPKKDRAQLHEEVYEKLAKENNMTVEEIKAYKEANNLVIHECSDCKTILLIPREIHDNLNHGGGVEMLRSFNGL